MTDERGQQETTAASAEGATPEEVSETQPEQPKEATSEAHEDEPPPPVRQESPEEERIEL